jgi:hypothetical protein
MANLNNLTIKQFLKCKLISEIESEPVIRKLKLLAEITGKSFDEVESLPLGELYSQLRELDSLESLPSDAKVNMKFKADGKRFIIKWRQQDLTAEQYIDASHFCKEPDKIIHNIHNILASISVERGLFKELPYSGETHKERAEAILNTMTIKQAYPIMVFFCEYYKMLTDNTLTYIQEEAEKIVQEVKQHFTAVGDGLQQ